jgi:hypothetical protein
MADTYAGYDLAVIAQRTMGAAYFHDNRLRLALDVLGTGGLDRVD